MTIDKKRPQDMQVAILKAIVEQSLTEIDGEKVAHVRTAEVLDAFSLVVASLMSTSPETKNAEGVKRAIRRMARQMEQRVIEFKAHARQHGAPFAVYGES